ncbi:hypothetical protein, partial [Salmonella enterica]|uniref:hypothetical protein n=1 Tax=Salmonella enterica TaxID=28901 RepID=UPI00398C4E5D
MVVDVEHFNMQRPDVDGLAFLGNALERVDDQPSEGFDVVLAGQVVEVEGAFHVAQRRDTVDQAGAVIAAHDLLVFAKV